MLDIASVATMRASDAAAIAGGTAGAELMRRAGEGIYASADWAGPVGIVCGKGNNAGDGYVLAHLLHLRGIPCELLLKEHSFTPDGRHWFDVCRADGVPVRLWEEIDSLERFRTVVDCIWGTGYRDQPASPEAGAAPDPYARMIDLISASGAFVVSADINSGLNGDNGLGRHPVRSDLTVSIGSYKPGHFLNQAQDCMKRRVNIDIGIPLLDHACRLMEAADAAPFFAPRPHFSNKGSYGPVALIGGSLPYSGAIRLAGLAESAMRSGAGVVRLALPRPLAPIVAPAVLESTLFPLSESGDWLRFVPSEWERLIRGMKVIAFGMGVGHTAETEQALRFLLSAFGGLLILDADGLNALSALGPELLLGARPRVILTPHPGEFARLTGRAIPDIQADSLNLAAAFAARYGVTLLLKGPATLVTDGRETLLVDRGCPGMATAGSGDVLSGILAALCAAHPADPLLTTAVAAYVNGLAGEIAQAEIGDVSMVASDTVRALPRATRALRETAGR